MPIIYVLEQTKGNNYTPVYPSFNLKKWVYSGLNYTGLVA